MKIKRITHPYAKSLDACFAREGTAGIAQGQVMANKHYVGLLGTTQEITRSKQTPSEAKQKIFKKLADPEEKEIEDSGRMFPSDDQIKQADIGHMAETIIVATDPLPYPILIDEHQKNVPAGQKYMATKKIKDFVFPLLSRLLQRSYPKK